MDTYELKQHFEFDKRREILDKGYLINMRLSYELPYDDDEGEELCMEFYLTDPQGVDSPILFGDFDKLYEAWKEDQREIAEESK